MPRKLYILSMVLMFPATLYCQLNFYEATFNGGVTVAGYSPPYFSGGLGTMTINVPAGSTIHKAYLFAGRHGNIPSLTVTLNSTNLTFNSINQVTPTFQSPAYGGNSAVHAIDVTSLINVGYLSYSLNVPFETGPSNRFNDFCLYVAYDNLSMPLVTSVVFLNQTDFQSPISYNNLSLITPINTSNDVGISVFTGYCCNSSSDGEYIDVNGNALGEIGSNDMNSGSCGGPLGSFYYDSNTLTALNDDNSNQSMSDADALSNARLIIPNMAASVSLQFTHSILGNLADNAIWGVFLTYTSAMVLPIELENFSAMPDHDHVNLAWTTASEFNNDYFDVQRSQDGEHYETVTPVKGAGYSQSPINYAARDEFPMEGRSYYRLKQISFDSTFSYSDVVLVNMNEVPMLSNIYFDAQSDILAISFTTGDVLMTVEVIDVCGRTLRKKSFVNTAGVIKIAASDFTTGVYLIRISDATHSVVRKVKIG
ncbi:MAG TPA: T9SS type A sorting domain-containing protein [Chitinophagales bacterium]|nr:T9SS type A sorting domain-containing protein [Chitinophagales bacterium]